MRRTEWQLLDGGRRSCAHLRGGCVIRQKIIWMISTVWSIRTILELVLLPSKNRRCAGFTRSIRQDFLVFEIWHRHQVNLRRPCQRPLLMAVKNIVVEILEWRLSTRRSWGHNSRRSSRRRVQLTVDGAWGPIFVV